MKRLALLLLTMATLDSSFASQVLSDSFGKVPDDDVYARVDHFGAEVQKDPDLTGHIVVYKATNQPLGAFLRYLYGIKDVWRLRGYPVERLVLHAGQEKQDLFQDFWILHKAEQISPKEFSIETKLKEQIIEKRIFDSQCVGCDPAVLLHQWIFREGLEYYGIALKANPGARAEIMIGKNAYVSGTKKERNELRSKIFLVLTTKYNVPKDQISIRFINSMFAKFYIIPMSKIAHKTVRKSDVNF